MQAIHVEISESQRKLVTREADFPRRNAGEILVEVKAISLNHGEVYTALYNAQAGARPGWEYAGIVLKADADSRFSEGDRVVGLMLAGAWAQRVSAPEQFATTVPEGVDLEVAATLPVAGLTAALSLAKNPPHGESRVLITGANGAVGRIALQLAAATGANVTAYIRQARHQELVRSLGANEVIGPESDFHAVSPFDLVLEGVGGELLAKAMTHLASNGVCVLYGNAAHAEETTFKPDAFRLRAGALYGGTTLYGFFLGNELTKVSIVPVLDGLLEALRQGQLNPSIALIDDFHNIDAVGRALTRNQIDGRAVLRVPSHG